MTPATFRFAVMLLGAACPKVASAQQEVTFPTANPDRATVYADLYDHDGALSRGVALLFHDQASNAQEYADIAPNFAATGFDAVAVDLRTGYDTAVGTNRTYWHTTSYVNFFDDGIPDAQGALDWARQEWPDRPIILVGSGISADFVIAMAADNPEGLAGVMAFSPPSSLFYTDEVEVASRLTVPLFLTYATEPTDESEMVSKISGAAPADLLTLLSPETGLHGIATLSSAANPVGWQANWAAARDFLDRVAP